MVAGEEEAEGDGAAAVDHEVEPAVFAGERDAPVGVFGAGAHCGDADADETDGVFVDDAAADDGDAAVKNLETCF